jgi:hypothetical protein
MTSSESRSFHPTVGPAFCCQPTRSYDRHETIAQLVIVEQFPSQSVSSSTFRAFAYSCQLLIKGPGDRKPDRSAALCNRRCPCLHVCSIVDRKIVAVFLSTWLREIDFCNATVKFLLHQRHHQPCTGLPKYPESDSEYRGFESLRRPPDIRRQESDKFKPSVRFDECALRGP